MIDEKYIKEHSCVAYLAHPYGGNHQNMVEARLLAGTLYEEFPKLTILNPLDNGEYMLGDDEETIIKHDLELLARCDVLILAPGWEDSKGCNKELSEAIDRSIDILQVEENKDGRLVLKNIANLSPKADKPQWADMIKSVCTALNKEHDLAFLAVAAIGKQSEKGTLNIISVKCTGEIYDVINNASMAMSNLAYRIGKIFANDKETVEKLKSNGVDVTNPEMCKEIAQSLLGVAVTHIGDAADHDNN